MSLIREEVPSFTLPRGRMGGAIGVADPAAVGDLVYWFTFLMCVLFGDTY